MATDLNTIIDEKEPEAFADVGNSLPDAETPKKTEDKAPKEELKTKEKESDDDHDDLDQKSNTRHIPFKELKKERQKRQELERQLAEMSGQVKAYTQHINPQGNQPVKHPSQEDMFFRDPVAFMENRVRLERLNLSEQMVRQQHPEDYQQAVDAFLEMSKMSPDLVRQMGEHQNPAYFAYENGKTYLEAKDVGSISELREKIRNEERQKLEDEYSQKYGQAIVKNLPKTIAGARGSGSETTQPFTGPTSLRSMLGGR
jgi:hypothetical protein